MHFIMTSIDAHLFVIHHDEGAEVRISHLVLGIDSLTAKSSQESPWKHMMGSSLSLSHTDPCQYGGVEEGVYAGIDFFCTSKS